MILSGFHGMESPDFPSAEGGKSDFTFPTITLAPTVALRDFEPLLGSLVHGTRSRRPGE